ncbi:MAG TPA: hypothetical protein DCR44_00180 [Acholeplasmatales bacterium]|nr:MAG: hypothetical protein A2Y16_04980 [Tenericutes bacterium GWF2_57_13]HAQ55821.1 hypothetical protein [Acholeplasmatales bacterium]
MLFTIGPNVCPSESHKKKEGCRIENFKLYTIDEITVVLKVTQRTVYNYINSGGLKAVKIGKYWRVKHADLQSFIDNGTALLYHDSDK